jgi:diacylglycerol kinase (ATP)
VPINHIFFIVNPAAGKDEPIEEKINEVFADSGLRQTIHVLKEKDDVTKIVHSASKLADLIAVYGGDGSITLAATALINSETPLAIIPGGTANVLSKELDIPQDTIAALTLIKEGKYQIRSIDTGLVNGRPFLLRVNLGIMAEMITETNPDLKDKIGQLAYGVATVKSIMDAEPVSYQLNIDGKTVKAAGVSLTITNSGNMGVGDLQMQPGISVSDGLLDIILLKDAGIISIVKAAGAALLEKKTDAVEHWTCKEVTVKLPEEQSYLCDDYEVTASELRVKIIPSSLKVVVP